MVSYCICSHASGVDIDTDIDSMQYTVPDGFSPTSTAALHQNLASLPLSSVRSPTFLHHLSVHVISEISHRTDTSRLT